MTRDQFTPERPPQIVDATPDENARARQLVHDVLDHAVTIAAGHLADQKLSIKTMMARLLIEDFAALDCYAARDWLDANHAENAATHWLQDSPVRTHRINSAREQRCDAFTRLAEAEIRLRPSGFGGQVAGQEGSKP